MYVYLVRFTDSYGTLFVASTFDLAVAWIEAQEDYFTYAVDMAHIDAHNEEITGMFTYQRDIDTGKLESR